MPLGATLQASFYRILDELHDSVISMQLRADESISARKTADARQ
jgi:hypothetical protein